MSEAFQRVIVNIFVCKIENGETGGGVLAWPAKGSTGTSGYSNGQPYNTIVAAIWP